jgi:hypothetical protein
MNLVEKYLGEKTYSLKDATGTTKDALKSLDALMRAVGNEKDGKMGKEAGEIWDMAEGIEDYFRKNGSISPKQADWIFKTWKSFKGNK